MLNIAQQTKFALLLGTGRAGRVIADRLRKVGVDEVSAALDLFEGELAGLSENRAGRRATAAADRRSTEPPQAPRKGLSRAELRKREHERKQDQAYAAELERRSVDWRPVVQVDEHGKQWRPCPREVWRMSQDVVSCTSAAAWRYWARRCPNKPALGALRRAALLPRADGTCKRAFGSSRRARLIAALGLSMLMLGKHTARKGPWQHVVRGIPVALMQELLTCPDGSGRPSVNAIIGQHRGVHSDHTRGQQGYLRALEATGFIHKSQQCYPDAADWEQGKLVRCKDGRTFRAQISRYWLISNPPLKAHRPELLELEREGWLSLDEPAFIPRRARRTEPTQPAPS